MQVMRAEFFQSGDYQHTSANKFSLRTRPLHDETRYRSRHVHMSTHQTDARVDRYIATLPEWQQHLCARVRDLVHAADPEVTETIKRSSQPYFVLAGNIA
jgi:hypothetical protein